MTEELHRTQLAGPPSRVQSVICNAHPVTPLGVRLGRHPKTKTQNNNMDRQFGSLFRGSSFWGLRFGVPLDSLDAWVSLAPCRTHVVALAHPR